MLLLIRQNKLIQVYSGLDLRHVTVNQKQQTDTGLFSVRLRHVTVNQKQQTTN